MPPPPALLPKGPLRAHYTADNALKANPSTQPTLQKNQDKIQEKTQDQDRNKGRARTGRIHTVAEAAKRIVTRRSGGEKTNAQNKPAHGVPGGGKEL